MFENENEYNNDNNGDYIRPVEEYRADCEDYHEYGQTYEDYNAEQRVYEAHNENEDDFRSILMPGENLLWCGKAEKGLSGLAGSCVVMIFPMFWLGFALFWTFSAAMQSHGGFMAIFGIPFIIIGLYQLKKMFFSMQSKNKYAITDRRVIINYGKKVVSERLENICNITYKENKNNRGYVMFGIMSASNMHGSYGNQRVYSDKYYTFSGIRNPAEAFRILNDAIYSATNLR